VDKVSELEPKALALSLTYKMRPGISLTDGNKSVADLFRESIKEIPVAVLKDMLYLTLFRSKYKTIILKSKKLQGQGGCTSNNCAIKIKSTATCE